MLIRCLLVRLCSNILNIRCKDPGYSSPLDWRLGFSKPQSPIASHCSSDGIWRSRFRRLHIHDQKLVISRRGSDLCTRAIRESRPKKTMPAPDNCIPTNTPFRQSLTVVRGRPISLPKVESRVRGETSNVTRYQISIRLVCSAFISRDLQTWN